MLVVFYITRICKFYFDQNRFCAQFSHSFVSHIPRISIMYYTNFKLERLLKLHDVFLYSVNLTEYVAMEPRVCVCVCVCLSVCLSVCVWKLSCSNGWVDFDEIFYKWFDRYLRGPFFSDFENSKSMTSLRPFCMFCVGALSWSQFCFDFVQNWWVGRKLSSAVCYLKSARSVGNFCQYSRPRFRKFENQNGHQK